MSDAQREAFIASYTSRFPLRPICQQGGVFYGETQEHYETWKTSLASQPRISESELVDLLSQYMWERNGSAVTFKGNVTGCAQAILAKFPQIKEGV